MKIINWEQVFVHCKIVSAVQRVDFISDRLSYIVLRGCWNNSIVVNVVNLVIKTRNLLNGTFINTRGPPLMVRITTRLTTY